MSSSARRIEVGFDPEAKSSRPILVKRETIPEREAEFAEKKKLVSEQMSPLKERRDVSQEQRILSEYKTRVKEKKDEDRDLLERFKKI